MVVKPLSSGTSRSCRLGCAKGKVREASLLGTRKEQADNASDPCLAEC